MPNCTPYLTASQSRNPRRRTATPVVLLNRSRPNMGHTWTRNFPTYLLPIPKPHPQESKPTVGFEPTTAGLQNQGSTVELRWHTYIGRHTGLCQKTRSGFERLVSRLPSSGCIDDETDIACFAVFARRKNARSRADDGVFRQNLGCQKTSH